MFGPEFLLPVMEKKDESLAPLRLLTALPCTESSVGIQIIILLPFFFSPLKISLLQDLPTPDLR